MLNGFNNQNRSIVIPTRIRLKPLDHKLSSVLVRFLFKNNVSEKDLIRSTHNLIKTSNKFTFLKSLNSSNKITRESKFNFFSNIQSDDNSTDNIILKIPKKLKKKYKFADFENFVRKTELYYKIQIIKLLLHVKRNFAKLRESNEFIKQNNISHNKFNNVLADTFTFLNFEKNFHKRLINITLHKLFHKLMKYKILRKIKDNYRNTKNKIILIQSVMRLFVNRKKIIKYKRAKQKILKLYKNYRFFKYIQKTKIIQKFIRGFISRRRLKEYISDYRECLRLERMRLGLEEKRKQNKIKVRAVRVIEDFWNNILDKREDIKLEEQIQAMPKDCRDLYRKFVRLRKQTKKLKDNLTEICK